MPYYFVQQFFHMRRIPHDDLQFCSSGQNANMCLLMPIAVCQKKVKLKVRYLECEKKNVKKDCEKRMLRKNVKNRK